MELTDKEIKKLRSKLEKLLIPEAVEEAVLILTTCDEKWYKSFNEEYKKRSKNTACCAIDFAKDYLVKDGKLEDKEGDHFGGMLSQIE